MSVHGEHEGDESPRRKAWGRRRFARPATAPVLPNAQPTTDRSAGDDNDLDQYVDALCQALSQREQLSRRELSKLTDSKTWGARRFGRALELGVLSGRIRRIGHDKYAAGG